MPRSSLTNIADQFITAPSVAYMIKHSSPTTTTIGGIYNLPFPDFAAGVPDTSSSFGNRPLHPDTRASNMAATQTETACTGLSPDVNSTLIAPAPISVPSE